MSEVFTVVLLALAVGSAGALCIFSAYDLGLHRGRQQGVQQERRRSSGRLRRRWARLLHQKQLDLQEGGERL